MSPYDKGYTKDAVQHITEDYEYLKQKVMKLQKKLEESDRDRECLEKQLETVKTENVKFITDIKIMKGENSEIMHTMMKVERRIDQLERENMYFKSVLESRPRETYTNERELTLNEEPDTVSELEARYYIGDNYPQTNVSAETRIRQFQPIGMNRHASSDKLDVSNISSQKDTFSTNSKLQKRRFLIPVPESKMTAQFKSTEH